MRKKRSYSPSPGMKRNGIEPPSIPEGSGSGEVAHTEEEIPSEMDDPEDEEELILDEDSLVIDEGDAYDTEGLELQEEDPLELELREETPGSGRVFRAENPSWDASDPQEVEGWIRRLVGSISLPYAIAVIGALFLGAFLFSMKPKYEDPFEEVTSQASLQDLGSDKADDEIKVTPTQAGTTLVQEAGLLQAKIDSAEKSRLEAELVEARRSEDARRVAEEAKSKFEELLISSSHQASYFGLPSPGALHHLLGMENPVKEDGLWILRVYVVDRSKNPYDYICEEFVFTDESSAKKKVHDICEVSSWMDESSKFWKEVPEDIRIFQRVTYRVIRSKPFA